MNFPRLSPKTKRVLVYTVVVVVLVLILSWRLGSLPDGLSQVEAEFVGNLRNLGWLSPDVLSHLVYYLPIKAVLGLSNETTMLLLRIVNLAFAFTGLVAFYVLARNWWSRTIALASTALLATSGWFLVVIRLIEPGVAALLWLPLLLLMFLKLKHESKWWQVFASGAVSGLAFYVSPILAWLSLALVAAALRYSMKLNRGRIVNGWLIFFFSFVVALIPLLVAIVQEPSVALKALGVTSINTPVDMLRRAVDLGRSLLIDTKSVYFVPGLALADVGTVVLALYGLLRTLATVRLGRSSPVLFVLIISLFITILTPNKALLYAYLLPIGYLLVARGLNQFMSEWYRRFPRNPTARLVGAGALVLLVGLVSLYNTRIFYVAWARNEQVRTIFNQSVEGLERS